MMNTEKKTVIGLQLDEERALYGSDGIIVRECRFDGPADGESALKESRDVLVEDCYFNLRYPFWHNGGVSITRTELTPLCRAALWYSSGIEITDSKLHGIKALRECHEIKIKDCDVVSTEFGWFSSDISVENSKFEGEYFMMRSKELDFAGVSLKGKYSFQYIEDSTFENCNFDTKDALWHAKNVVLSNCTVKGEYLAWYCENVTFVGCKISGTQPFCYCKGLKLIDCKMLEADLCFEKSEVEATLTAPVISIKNPRAGSITVPECGEQIWDDPGARGVINILNT